MTTQHVDFSEVVKNYFAQTGELHPGIFALDLGRIEELIDAVPDENQGLISALRNLLRIWRKYAEA